MEHYIERINTNRKRKVSRELAFLDLITMCLKKKVINFGVECGMLKKNLYICGRKVATKLQYIRIN
jgi:hypothetical protein